MPARSCPARGLGGPHRRPRAGRHRIEPGCGQDRRGERRHRGDQRRGLYRGGPGGERAGCRLGGQQRRRRPCRPRLRPYRTAAASPVHRLCVRRAGGGPCLPRGRPHRSDQRLRRQQGGRRSGGARCGRSPRHRPHGLGLQPARPELRAHHAAPGSGTAGTWHRRRPARLPDRGRRHRGCSGRHGGPHGATRRHRQCRPVRHLPLQRHGGDHLVRLRPGNLRARRPPRPHNSGPPADRHRRLPDTGGEAKELGAGLLTPARVLRHRRAALAGQSGDLHRAAV